MLFLVLYLCVLLLGSLHDIAFKQLTYVQPVLMLMYKIPTLNNERGPKCF